MIDPASDIHCAAGIVQTSGWILEDDPVYRKYKGLLSCFRPTMGIATPILHRISFVIGSESLHWQSLKILELGVTCDRRSIWEAKRIIKYEFFAVKFRIAVAGSTLLYR
jgi:hypothetical protein